MNTVLPHRKSMGAKKPAHPAITAGLLLALTAGPALLPHATALAEQGHITITQQHNQGATYDAYCVFLADIDANDSATHVSWAPGTMKTVVLNYLDDHGYGDWLADNHNGTGQHDLAQNAAEYIAYMIGGSLAEDSSAIKPQTTLGKSFAQGLAQALTTGSGISKSTAYSGVQFEADEGYWLFVTSKSTLESSSDNEAGTSPIWVPLGGRTTTINEKSAIPTVTKDVKDDKGSAWGKVADAHTGQDLSYRLSATLPDNYHSYDSYHLSFTDTLSSGLSVAMPASGKLADGVFVTVGEMRVAASSLSDAVSVTLAGNVLTIDFPDLKDGALGGFNITDSSVISIEYQAHLNDSSQTGPAGNANGVRLTYSNDPVGGGDGHTTNELDTTKTFAYELSVLKVDKQTNEPLGNAAFTLQVANTNTDAASKGKYVQADGSLGTQPYNFVTNSQGMFSVKGIDEGVYTLHEVTPPNGYAAMSGDMTLTITSTFNDSERTLTSLVASVSGHDTADTTSHIVSGVSVASDQDSLINLKVTDDRWLTMPLTGLEGLGASSLVGVSLAAVAVGGYWARKRRLG